MSYIENYNQWKEYKNLDSNLKKELESLSEAELEDAFYMDLEFGTGGLRGILGVGTNRMNIYTVRRATKAFGTYLLSKSKAKERGICISHDNRYMSREFAITSAKVLTKMGFRVYLFEDLRPTPELSYSVRSKHAIAGIMITASHNPKEYNGYKIYDEYGCQLLPDEANKVIDEIDHIIKKYDKNAIMAGEGPCMKDLVNIADEDFKNVSITSIGIIFIIMLFVLKSVSLPVLLVSGIELAIFINMAISYYTGDVLPFVASIVIGTIQLGATIDYAILLTTKYLENRKNGIDKIKAMDNAISNSAGSIFVSGMSFFAATFGVGMISKLNMIGSLCNLMSRGALISMFIVICVIPAILLVFDKVIIHTSIGFKQLKNNEKGEC